MQSAQPMLQSSIRTALLRDCLPTLRQTLPSRLAVYSLDLEFGASLEVWMLDVGIWTFPALLSRGDEPTTG